MPRRKDTITLPPAARSYMSVAYGVLAVVILVAIVFLGIRALSQRNAEISDEAGQTMQTTYEVKEGDSLWSIAESEYNDGYKWTEIAKANNIVNPDEIEKGMKLTLPSVEEVAIKPTDTPTPPSGAVMESQDKKITGDSYKVVEGDNLWTIAVRAYGDGYKWVEIAKVNKLANPDLIFPGNQFKLPR